MATTTTVYCGWSGFSDPTDERVFNRRIIEEVNRRGPWAALEGNGITLTILCNYKEAATVRAMAEEIRDAWHYEEMDADALDDDMGKRLQAAGLEGLQDHARRQYEMYNAKGEPLANGPRCATCGDLIAWGSHPMCERDDAGEIFRAGERHNQ